MDYFLSIATTACFMILMCQGLNITFGLGKIFNLAHVAIYAVGAYTCALLVISNYNFYLAMVIALLLCSVLAWAIGRISLRISGDYLAIATLALHQIVMNLILNWTSLTRGPLGIPGIYRPTFLGFHLYTGLNFFLFTLAVTVIILALLYALFRSRLARDLAAIGEDDSAAAALGKSAPHAKNLAFIIGSSLAVIAGGLMAVYLQFIDPTVFVISELIAVLTAVILGRMGSFWGVLAAAIFVSLLPEPLRFLSIPGEYIGPVRQILYAVILFTVMYFQRHTLFVEHRQV